VIFQKKLYSQTCKNTAQVVSCLVIVSLLKGYFNYWMGGSLYKEKTLRNALLRLYGPINVFSLRKFTISLIFKYFDSGPVQKVKYEPATRLETINFRRWLDNPFGSVVRTFPPNGLDDHVLRLDFRRGRHGEDHGHAQRWHWKTRKLYNTAPESYNLYFMSHTCYHILKLLNQCFSTFFGSRHPIRLKKNLTAPLPGLNANLGHP